MFSVAILDFVQMVVVMGGMLFIGYLVSGMTGGVDVVVAHASAAGKLDFFPSGNWVEWLAFIAAWMTMMLGSIPQQDVFQRITSAKSARVAIWASILGGTLYFCFTFVPMFIAYAATLINPEQFNALIETDSQLVLPTLVMQHTPVFAQAIFFGAVLAAIMACSSATLLAPSVSFSENILRNIFPEVDDRGLLRMMRITMVCFAGLVLLFALNSESTIFEMVENAYKITLAGAFVPLFFGAYWSRATTQGALTACIGGVGSWLIIELLVGEASLVPPQLIGLGVSILGMIVGSLLPQRIGRPTPHEDIHHALHHRAAAETHHAADHPHHH
jgi:Na+/proline symporter